MKKISRINFKEMKKWLMRGEIKELAEEHNIGVHYAYHILAGRKYHPEFIQAFVERVTERKAGIMKSINRYHNVRKIKTQPSS